MTVTLQDIADTCGVHKMTVSRALRGNTSISAETTARVQAAAAALGYQPAHNESARRLVMRRTGQQVINQVAAFFLPPFVYNVNYFARLHHGVIDTLTSHNFATLVSHVDYLDSDSAFALPPVFARGDVDGIITLTRPETLQVIFDHLTRIDMFPRMPLISMMWPMTQCSSVVVDDEDGAYQAARHLLELGHRHLLTIIFTDGNVIQERRLRGMRRALAEWQLPPTALLTFSAFSLGSLSAGQHLQLPVLATGRTAHPLGAYLDAHPKITALLAPNDATALRAWHILEHGGWQVPEEISIIGFDDTDPNLDAIGENRLTSVHLPLDEVGNAAGELLLQLVHAHSTSKEHLVLPTTLVVRTSTTPPPHMV